MNKKLISGCFYAAVLVPAVQAATLEEKIMKLEKSIQKHQEQLEELKNNYYEEDIRDLSQRMTDVEVRSYTDKIQFGLGFENELHYYDVTYADGSGYDTNDLWRTKLHLNMQSQISKNLEFTGRLSMYKNWGDSTSRNSSSDSMQGRKPDDSKVYAERAYIDWTMNPKMKLPVTMTLGRQPSSDGPSHQIKENTARKGTYSALAFDGAADGIVFTADLDNYVSSSYLRFAYGTPNVQDQQQGPYYYGADNDSLDDTKVMGVFYDSSAQSLPFKNLLQVYYVYGQDLNADPDLEPDKNVGDLSLAGFSIGGMNIADRWDLFLQYANVWIRPDGNTVDMSGTGGSATTGLLSDSSTTEEKTANAIWLGTRYKINDSWKVGAEYNRGSKNWFSFTTAADDPLNKLATRGQAYELYATYIINKYANIRLGFTQVEYDYTGSQNHLGAPEKITSSLGEDAVQTVKNSYLKFNLLF